MTDSSNNASAPERGLGASLQGLMATLVAILHTRLELLVTELEEEKRRFLATLAWGAVAVLVGCFGLAFAAVFITVLFWDTHRLWALGLVTLGFCSLSAWSVYRVKSLWQESGELLSATLAELQADRQFLAPSEAADQQATKTGNAS